MLDRPNPTRSVDEINRQSSTPVTSSVIATAYWSTSDESAVTMPTISTTSFTPNGSHTDRTTHTARSPLIASNHDTLMYTMPEQPKRHLSRYENIGERLIKRKWYYKRKKRISYISLAVAVLGIILMIIETELFMAGVYSKSSLGSFVVKSLISLSTLVLLGTIIWYNVVDVQLYMLDNSIENWALALTPKRLLKIAVELAVCVVHPFPGDYDYKTYDVDPLTGDIQGTVVTVDVFLSVPMFLRLYLLGRVIIFGVEAFSSASSQTLAALNRTKFNAMYTFKSLMVLHPIMVLLVLTIGSLLITSWSIRAAEMYYVNGELSRDILNALWVVCITFLTVGYGDITPSSYCGRAVAVLTGISGTLITALVVAVVARKLEFTRPESTVHSFMISIQLQKQMKSWAAKTIQFAWRSGKARQKGHFRAFLQYQKLFMDAVFKMRKTEQKLTLMKSSSLSIADVHSAQNYMEQELVKIQSQHHGLEKSMESMTTKMDSFDAKLSKLISLLKKRKRSEGGQVSLRRQNSQNTDNDELSL